MTRAQQARTTRRGAAAQPAGPLNRKNISQDEEGKQDREEDCCVPNTWPRSESARANEAKSLQVRAENRPVARILAGDYSMQSGSKESNAATVGNTDAWAAAKSRKVATSYRGNCDGCTRNSRIDYVFTSKTATFLAHKSAQIIDTRDAAGVMPSDHKPMLVVYEVR